mgnify:CR=1 FL=1
MPFLLQSGGITDIIGTDKPWGFKKTVNSEGTYILKGNWNGQINIDLGEEAINKIAERYLYLIYLFYKAIQHVVINIFSYQQNFRLLMVFLKK